jgi:WD40 repeat protein
MNLWKLIRRALGLSSAIAILAGCDNAYSQVTPVPSTQQSALRLAPNVVADRGTSTRLRSRQASLSSAIKKTHPLLYVSDANEREVFVYKYPNKKLVSTLTGFHEPRGECVDANGDVFIVDEWVPAGTSKIYEYAHGGTSPIATLSDSGEFAYGCSINPNTGDLAVSSVGTPSDGPGSVAIYANAQGTPTLYADPNMVYGALFLSYDPNGNIFVNGLNSEQVFELDELPTGSSTFTSITLNQSMGFPAGVQWVGSTLAVGSTQASAESVIYEFSISGSSGTEVGSTQLTLSSNVVQFFIKGSTVIGPDAGKSDVRFWNYPSGGPPKKTIKKGLAEPIAAVISE